MEKIQEVVQTIGNKNYDKELSRIFGRPIEEVFLEFENSVKAFH